MQGTGTMPLLERAARLQQHTWRPARRKGQPARSQAGQRRVGAARTGSHVAPAGPKMLSARTETPDQIRNKKREPLLPAPSNEYSAPSLTTVRRRQRPTPGRTARSPSLERPCSPVCSSQLSRSRGSSAGLRVCLSLNSFWG